MQRLNVGITAAGEPIELLEATRDLNAVCVAHLERRGALIEANRGFQRLLRDLGLDRDTGDLRAVFVSPLFGEFAARRPVTPGGVVYQGRLTLGDSRGSVVSLDGQVRAGDDGLWLIAEHPLEDLTRLGDTVQRLNQTLVERQRELARLNRMLLRERSGHHGLRQVIEQLRAALALYDQEDQRSAMLRHAASRLESLTEREREVLDLLVEGHTHKVIARKLGISDRTVATHREHIMTKTGAESLPELVRIHLFG